MPVVEGRGRKRGRRKKRRKKKRKEKINSERDGYETIPSPESFHPRVILKNETIYNYARPPDVGTFLVVRKKRAGGGRNLRNESWTIDY